METASFIFTCNYNHGTISGLFRDLGIELKGDPHKIFNQHLQAVSRLFLPHINPRLIDRLDMKLCPAGNPLLVFYTRPIRYSRYESDYLAILPGISTKLPIIMEIKGRSPDYTLELEPLK